MTGTFQRSRRKSAIQRDHMSPPPPAANPTMTVTGRFGNVSAVCAWSVVTTRRPKAATSLQIRIIISSACDSITSTDAVADTATSSAHRFELSAVSRRVDAHVDQAGTLGGDCRIECRHELVLGSHGHAKP